MKISIAASGTRGDVQPYVALGTGLKAAGHDVQVLTSADFESLITGAGLNFRSLGHSVEEMLQSPEWRKMAESGNFLRIVAKMNSEMSQHARELAALLPSLLEGSELIITGLGGLGGVNTIAEMRRIPIIQAYVFPLTPTGDYASPLMPFDSAGGMINRASFFMMQQMLWQTGRMGDVATRKLMSLPRASILAPIEGLRKRGVPIVYGYSSHVIPRPLEWEDRIQVTGYWFLDAVDYAPPADLVEFLNSGSPPVYIGFGSMGSRNPKESAALALKALELSGQRGLIASGWGGLSASDLPDTVYMLKAAPHSWLFPRMSAVVHHGGAGTTAAGLRAGIPSIVVPFMGDQPFWGRRVAALGVGTAPIPRKRLTAEALAAAIRQTLTDSAMRQRAAVLGEKLRAEDGIANAVAAIQKWCDRRA